MLKEQTNLSTVALYTWSSFYTFRYTLRCPACAQVSPGEVIKGLLACCCSRSFHCHHLSFLSKPLLLLFQNLFHLPLQDPPLFGAQVLFPWLIFHLWVTQWTWNLSQQKQGQNSISPLMILIFMSNNIQKYTYIYIRGKRRRLNRHIHEWPWQFSSECLLKHHDFLLVEE